MDEDIRMLATGDQGFSATEVMVDENFVRSQMEQSMKLKLNIMKSNVFTYFSWKG